MDIRIIHKLSKWCSIFLWLISAVTSNAEEYKSLVNYDRVWECACMHHSFTLHVKYIKFDSTEEILGKTYHKLITIGKLDADIDNEGVNTWGLEEDIYDHEGYLREEDGCVYTLTIASLDDRLNGVDAPLARYTGNGEDYPDGYIIEEALIYDFSKKPGEEFEGITYSFGNNQRSIFHVENESLIEIDGEDCILQEMDCYNEGCHYPATVIQGIGAGTGGCLNYHCFSDGPAFPYMFNEICRVFNRDREVIYINPDFEDFQFPYPLSSGIIGLQDVGNTHKGMKYDIFGREIRRPMPGQIYIQGGRKYVAPQQ